MSLKNLSREESIRKILLVKNGLRLRRNRMVFQNYRNAVCVNTKLRTKTTVMFGAFSLLCVKMTSLFGTFDLLCVARDGNVQQRMLSREPTDTIS